MGFGIQLIESDGYLLQKIADRIGCSTHGLQHINYDNRRRTMPGAHDQVRLCVYNKKIAEDIKELGVTRNKSRTLAYNGGVPDRFLPSFFRGLMDGDGNITIRSKPKRFECTLSSASKVFLNNLTDILAGRFSTSVRKRSPGKLSRNPFFIFRVAGGFEEGKRFAKWMYKDCDGQSLMLERKYEKVQSYIL